MVANLARPAALAPDVVQRIVAAAAGNPLYAEQMLSMLIDNGALRLEDGRWVRSRRGGGDRGAAHHPRPARGAAGQAGARRAGVDRAGLGDRAGVRAVGAGVAGARGGARRAAAATWARWRASSSSTPGRPRAPTRSSASTTTWCARPSTTACSSARAPTCTWSSCAGPTASTPTATAAWSTRRSSAGTSSRRSATWANWGRWAWRASRSAPMRARRLASAGRRALARGDMHAAANLLRPRRGRCWPRTTRPAGAAARAGRGADRCSASSPRRAAVLDEAVRLPQAAWDVRLEGAAPAAVGMFVRLYSGEAGRLGRRSRCATADAAIPTLERESAHSELAMAWRLVVLRARRRRALQPGQRGRRALHGACAPGRQRSAWWRAARWASRSARWPARRRCRRRSPSASA